MVGNRANAKLVFTIALNLVDVEEYDNVSDLFDEAVKIAESKENDGSLKETFFKAKVISEKIAYNDSLSLSKDELRDKVMDYIMSMFNY